MHIKFEAKEYSTLILPLNKLSKSLSFAEFCISNSFTVRWHHVHDYKIFSGTSTFSFVGEMTNNFLIKIWILVLWKKILIFKVANAESNFFERFRKLNFLDSIVFKLKLSLKISIYVHSIRTKMTSYEKIVVLISFKIR